MKFTILNHTVKIDNTYRIPYGAGANKTNTIVYIDSEMPETVRMKDGTVIDVYEALATHEIAEKMAMDLGDDYEEAHEMHGNPAEEEFVGKKYWKEYNKSIAPYLIHDNELKEAHIPKDLEMKPYHDEKKIKLIKDA